MNKSLKHLTPDSLYAQLATLTPNTRVSRDTFELKVENCKLEDIEWNHMDQLHRFSVHKTYEKAVRIAFGHDFAISLTQWPGWPLLITVTDVFIERGLFYQSLTLAGIVFIHSIVTMEPEGDSVKLKHEWFITSHKIFSFLHRFISKKFQKLNQRLQREDEPLRQNRFALRKEGFSFRTDIPNYYNSNQLCENTIYPPLTQDAYLSIEEINEQPANKKAGNLSFIVKKDINEKETAFLIWPSICPHEGGPLLEGKFCNSQVTCPWHGLRFSAVRISDKMPEASKYGFNYHLMGDKIYVAQIKLTSSSPAEINNNDLAAAMS